MPLTVRLAARARADITDILEWSVARFGQTSRTRYENLLDAAIQQIADDPQGISCHERSELRPGLWSLHLRSVPGG